MTITDKFIASLPQKPYCTDDYHFGKTIRPKEIAITKKFIQPNVPWNWEFMVFDVDRPGASLDWFDRGCPAPNIIAENPLNGHAHLFYGLQTPVHVHDGARNKPMRYAGAVNIALRRKLEADASYNGYLSKNPLHPNWINEIVDPNPYTLDGLAGFLDLEGLTDARKHLPQEGFGRNCTLFDETRFWSYRQIRIPQGWLSEDFFISAVTQFAAGYNQLNFQDPLPWTEVKSIGKSVGRWTYRKMSPAGYQLWGDNRRAKSIRVRKAGSFEKAEQVRLYKMTHPEATTRAIGEIFDCTAMSVSRYLRGIL